MTTKRQRLTDANVERLKPAAREYTVWDTRHSGLGVRIRPSGHRSFVYCRKGEDDTRRITLGSVALMRVEDVRRRCVAIDAEAGSDREERGATPTFGEFVAGSGRVCLDRCKPSTQRADRWVLKARLLPAFGSLPLDRITRAHVTRWFDEYSRTAPGGANHAMDLLRRLMNHAVACGHLHTNPTRGVKPNPRRKLTRFLSHEEVQRLHRELDHSAATHPSRTPQADIIRLLLLTGCRKSEIVTLRWQDVDGDKLNLVTPRRDLGACSSIRRPAPSWSGSLDRGAPMSSPRPRTPDGRSRANSSSGVRFAGRPISRTCACTTFVTRSPATPSFKASLCRSSPACSATGGRA